MDRRQAIALLAAGAAGSALPAAGDFGSEGVLKFCPETEFSTVPLSSAGLELPGQIDEMYRLVELAREIEYPGLEVDNLCPSCGKLLSLRDVVSEDFYLTQWPQSGTAWLHCFGCYTSSQWEVPAHGPARERIDDVVGEINANIRDCGKQRV